MGSLKLDKKQLEAVNCDRNVVVSAGAGSGKTTVLSKRYIRLIAEGKGDVESILTLTFTRKAASEMYERIYRDLLGEKDNPLLMEQAGRFEKARISTLDSFSADIVRNGAFKYGIPGDFNTDTEKIKALAYSSALDFILREQENRFLREFIELHGFENVFENLFVSIAVDLFDIASPVDFAGIYRRQKETLEGEYLKKISLVDSIRTRIGAMTPGKGKTYNENIRLCSLNHSLKELEDSSAVLKDITDFTLSLRTGKGEDAEIQKGLIRELREESVKLATVIRSLKSLPLVKGMFDLLASFQKEFTELKRRRGLLSFQDVATMAVKILQEDTALRRYYKNKFTHIMIDEFQDNNNLQKQLLFLLAEKKEKESRTIPAAEDLEPEKLFFVGDEKQSIYSFRGADVSVFKQLKGEILNSGGEFISLNTNYRSEPDLISFFNSFFREVFKNADAPYEAVFESLKSRKCADGIKPVIKFHYKPYDPEADPEALVPREGEAYHTAKTIKSIVEGKTLYIPGENGGNRPAEYGDIALLMRTTGDQILYEKYFRKMNIPFTVDSVRALFLEAPINDIYSFLQVVVYPDDKASYAALLRSPFVNLNDDVSSAILIKGDPAFALDEEDYAGIFTRDVDLERYMNGRRLYFQLKNLRDRVPKTTLIRILWYESGYRYLLMKNRVYDSYLEYYDYLEELARRSDEAGENLALFLDLIRSNIGKYEKIPDLEILRTEKTGVRFMTVHKSKGLEFPVVIVADTGNSGSGVDEKKPYFYSKEFGITLKAGGDGKNSDNYFYSAAKEENLNRLVAETKRILYVALTRAKTHLVISGVQGRNNCNPETETGKRTILNMVKSGIADNEDIIIETIPDYREDRVNTLTGKGIHPGPDNMNKIYRKLKTVEFDFPDIYYAASDLKTTASNDQNRGGNGRLLPGISSDEIIKRNNLETAFGTFCHRIIEADLNGTEFDREGFPPFSAVMEPERRILIKDGELLASGFLNSSFRGLVGKAVSAEPEISFLLKHEQDGRTVYIKGQADLVVEMEDEVIIIDFKTDRNMVPDIHAPQLYVYRKAMEEIYGKSSKSFLFYLRSGEKIECTEEFPEFLLAFSKTGNYP